MQKHLIGLAAACVLASTLPGQVLGEAPNLPVPQDGRIGHMPEGLPTDYKTGVLPKSARTRVDGCANAIPFSWLPTRYQQVFRGSELPRVLLVRNIGFRANWQTARGNTVDMEMKLGVSSFDDQSLSNTFASNWKTGTTPVTVLKRKKINVPNMTPNLHPGRFFFELKLDRTFLWRGRPKTNLLMEIVAHGNGNNNTSYRMFLNAESGSTTTRLFAFPTVTATTGTLTRGYGLVVNLTTQSQTKRRFGTVVPYGKGCPGSAKGPGTNCVVVNGNQTSPSGQTLRDNRAFVMEIIAPADTTVSGVEFFCGGVTATIPTFLYRVDATGLRPAAVPFTTSSLKVTTTAGFRKSKFAKPMPVRDGERFFVGFRTVAGLRAVGQTGTLPRYFWNGPNWSGPWQAFRFSYKLECTSKVGIPAITSSQDPAIGCPYDIDLAFARPTTAALLWLGTARTNLDLTALGAPGCRLLVSLNVLLPVATDAMGHAKINVAFPAAPSLVGVVLREQWAVLDGAANRFGFTFSRANEITIGGQ